MLNKVKYLLLVIGLLFLIPACTPEPTTQPEPIINGDLKDMLREYEANEVRAKDRFVGKLVQIEGKISLINEDSINLIPLYSDSFQISGAICNLAPEERNNLLRVNMNESVRVTGRVTRISSFLIVQYEIDDCKFVDENTATQAAGDKAVTPTQKTSKTVITEPATIKMKEYSGCSGLQDLIPELAIAGTDQLQLWSIAQMGRDDSCNTVIESLNKPKNLKSYYTDEAVAKRKATKAAEDRAEEETKAAAKEKQPATINTPEVPEKVFEKVEPVKPWGSLTLDGMVEIIADGTGSTLSGNGRYISICDANSLSCLIKDRETGSEEIYKSVNSWGGRGVSMSDDGHYIAFHSEGNDLVPNDSNGQQDVFLHNRETEKLTLLTVDNQGVQSNRASGGPLMNATGRSVVFMSASEVWGQPGNYHKLFLYDTETANLELISVNSEGLVANRGVGDHDISDDGRYIVFSSGADNLVVDDSNESMDLFLHDRKTGITERIGLETGDMTRISGDGRYVVFQSKSADIGPSGQMVNLFLYDIQTGITKLISETIYNGGQHANISDDGRYTVYYTPGDKDIVLVFDRETEQTKIVANSGYWPSISGDGRWVSFTDGEQVLVAGNHIEIS